MAQQHYYSRVPARMSMFNKTDGFDTFACSKGIDLAFAEDTLMVVDEIKLTAAENSEIRSGNWSPCYVQFNTAKGGTVRSLITYLPLDYTSERPGYMVHSLILNPDEHKKAIYDPDAAPINRALLVSNMDAFDLLSADAEPISDIPEVDYVCPQNKDRDLLVKNYPADTVKRFLYAALAAASGKLRNFYILLDTDKASDPSYMLGIINSVYSVLPIQLRSTFTFATRVNNISHLPVVKIKGIAASSLSKDIPASKGASADLDSGRFTGIRDEDIAACIDTVDLFFDMLTDDGLRSSYFEFCKHVYDNSKQTVAFGFKNLCELTTLFKAGSELFDLDTVLPDNDSVGEFLALYATYRDALPRDMRVRMINCIKRYSDAGIEIPKKIFTRITKLYKDEIGETRAVIMQSALELIHTDAMRDKLFVFIKNCYNDEDQKTRDNILTHLVSVFYGGFLQHKLIDFFAEKYRSASEDVRRDMLQKILLTVRTHEIRDSLLSFIDGIWESLDDSDKRSVVECYVEQLPEGDELARELIKRLDALLPASEEMLQMTATDLIISELEAESGEKAHSMLMLFVPSTGYCAERIRAWALSDADDQVFDDYIITSVSDGTLKERISALYDAYDAVTGESESGDECGIRLITSALRGFEQSPCDTHPAELFALMAELPENGFTEKVKADILHPLLANCITGVFMHPDSSVSVEQLIEYKRNSYPELGDSPDFDKLSGYLQLKKAFLTGDTAAMFAATKSMSDDKALRNAIGAYAENDLVAENTADVFVRRSLIVSYLKKGYCDVGACYNAWLEAITVQYADRRDDSLEKATVTLINRLFTEIAAIYNSEDTPTDAKQSLASDTSGIDEMVINAVTRYGNPAKQYIKKLIYRFLLDDSPIAKICTDAFERAKQSGNAFSRLLSVFKKPRR